MHSNSALLRDELQCARAETDRLFRLLSPRALYERPVEERHRLIFYKGHVEAFDWNILAGARPSIRPAFDRLFARGIDPEPGKAPEDRISDWPQVAEVETYTGATRQWVDANLETLPADLVQIAVEHRYMHAETLAYLLHNLPADDKLGRDRVVIEQRDAPRHRMIDIAGGLVTLGQQEGRFGWDNEKRAFETRIKPFAISKFKVSNEDWIKFVRDGGPVPHFWRTGPGGYLLRGMFGDEPLPLDHPVWVTWQQANAYAAWKGGSLPTEAQFHKAAQLTHREGARDNFGFVRWGTVAVDHGHEQTNGHAPVQMTGNGWEWTRDVFGPYAGFTPHPAYPGYSADFFDGAHYVLKGASPRTAALLTRPSFRNWFRPEYPHMYASFRLVNG